MKLKATAFAVLAALPLLSAGANAAPTAAELKGRVFGSLFGEYYLGHDNKAESANWDYLHDGWGVGAELGYRINENWAVRAEYARQSIESEVYSDRVKGNRFGLDALYYINQSNFYIAAGWKHFDAAQDTDALNLGVGYRYFVNDAFAFFAEANRYQGINKGSWYDAGLKLGFNWFFGAATAAPAPTPAPAPAAVVAPVVTDADGDGVPDAQDKCPNTPAAHKVDATGCTVYVEQVASVGDVDIEIRFPFDSATIPQSQLSDVNQLAAFLKRFPEATVAIEGHASNIGHPDYNLRLSQRRADSVAAILKAEGIDASRISATGYGITKPRAQGNTREAHRANQRIEAKVTAKIKEPVLR